MQSIKSFEIEKQLKIHSNLHKEKFQDFNYLTKNPYNSDLLYIVGKMDMHNQSELNLPKIGSAGNQFSSFAHIDNSINSAALIVHKSSLLPTVSTDLFTLKSNKFGIQKGLKNSDKFYDEPMAEKAIGTCFPITENCVVTAKHAIEYAFKTGILSISNPNPIDEIYVIFGFNASSTSIHKTNIYQVKKIAFNSYLNNKKDFTIFELDRPLSNEHNLKMLTVSDPKKYVEWKTPIHMSGYPSGLPLKITTDGNIDTFDEANGFYYTDLDVFKINSGSPVFNKKNELIGLLVGYAMNDFDKGTIVTEPITNVFKVKVLPINYITNFITTKI
jgi:V8-like Glu-specific endopeptidase